MRGLSAIQAGRIIGVTHATIHNYIKRGKLPARRVGVRKIVRIETEDLRKFAEQYQFDFDKELANRLGADNGNEAVLSL